MFLPLVFLVCAGPGDDVLVVFKEKCSVCHSVTDPKGGFNYVMDLKKLAADRDKIRPGNPEKSDLWLLVNAGNMPPNDSPSGPLSEAQKGAIKGWIEAGAPGVEAAVARAPSTVVVEPEPPPLSWFRRTWIWLGKFHLLLLHFPIALVFIAVLMEVVMFLRPGWVSVTTSNTCLEGAAALGLPVMGLGWMHSVNNGYGTLLRLHEIFGTLASILLVWTMLMAQRDTVRRSWFVRGMVAATAAVIGLAAHFGGEMVHGKNFLDW